MKISNELYGFPWTDFRANNCNTYLIIGEKKILIDPGHYHLIDHVTTQLRGLSLQPDDIDLVIVTHAHPDHMEGARVFSRKPALIAMHAIDFGFAQDMSPRDGSETRATGFRPDLLLQEGELKVGGMAFHVLHTPGHSPGSLCLYWPERRALFCGDVIFYQGIGRTDLPGGSGEELKASIKRLSQLDAEHLLPGHGQWISGRERVQSNFEQVENTWFGYL